jgi:hypothetical protein
LGVGAAVQFGATTQLQAPSSVLQAIAHVCKPACSTASQLAHVCKQAASTCGGRGEGVVELSRIHAFCGNGEVDELGSSASSWDPLAGSEATESEPEGEPPQDS